MHQLLNRCQLTRTCQYHIKQGSSLSCWSSCTWLRRTFWSNRQDTLGHHDEPSCPELIEAPKRHKDVRRALRARPRGPSDVVPRCHRERVSRQKQLVPFFRRSLKLPAACLQLKPPTMRPPYHGRYLTLTVGGETGIPHFTQKNLDLHETPAVGAVSRNNYSHCRVRASRCTPETNGRHEERPATDSRKRWRLIACQRAAVHKDTFLSPTFGSL